MMEPGRKIAQEPLIESEVKDIDIEGIVKKLRYVAMPVTFIALGLSLFEMFRYSLVFGPLPEGNSYVLVWVLFCLLGSITGCIGTYTVNKAALLAGCLLFCAALAPVTPCMIVLTNGVQ